MCFMHIGIFFFLILDVQKVDVINETSEKCQDRHLWQAGITSNNAPIKERVIKDMSSI
jgi:hypothetical protein